LDKEIACKAIWAFNHDQADAVPRDPLQQSLEAVTLPVVNGSADTLVSELPHDLNAVPLRVGLDGFPLTGQTVSADLTHRGHP
jgi:hypothetical protein